MDILAKCDQLAEALTAAVQQAFLDMASTDVCVRSVDQLSAPAPLGDMTVALTLSSPLDGWLLLSAGSQTADALARRTLTGTAIELNPALLADCLGEFANVVAGQLKALSAGTPFHFSFSPPVLVSTDDLRGMIPMHVLVIAFTSDVGEFAVQLCQRQ